VPDPDHHSLLHDVSTCPRCAAHLERLQPPRVEHDPGTCETCATRLDRAVANLGVDQLGEPVAGAPGWYASNVTDPEPTRQRRCGCGLCQPGQLMDLFRGAAPDRLIIDEVEVGPDGLEVSGHLPSGLDRETIARVFGVHAGLIAGEAVEAAIAGDGDAEPDWSDPDTGRCEAWHDRVPLDSHCAVCLWAPRDEGAFAQTTDPCVCQRGMRHSCGRAVGVVPERGTAEAEVAAAEAAEQEPDRGWHPQPERNRLERWVDRHGPAVLFEFSMVCLCGVLAAALNGWWFLGVGLAILWAAPRVRRWARAQPNPTGLPGWEIHRGRPLLRLPRPSLYRRPPVELRLWWWRHSLAGGPWSPWWPARSQARAQQAVSRWLPFDLPPVFPGPVATDPQGRPLQATGGHYQPAAAVFAGGPQMLTIEQVMARAAAFFEHAGIPLASPVEADAALTEAVEGVTISGPARSGWSVNTSVAAADPGTIPPETWDSAQIMHTDVLDQPCYRCGAGRVALSDLTGLCDPCKKELT
jgi:hypothetical protein